MPLFNAIVSRRDSLQEREHRSDIRTHAREQPGLRLRVGV